MFNVLQEEQTYGMQVFNAIMFFTIVFFFWRNYIGNFNKKSKRVTNIFFIFLFFVYAVTPTYTGDFWGYKPLVDHYDPTFGTWHLEFVYQELLGLIGPNYLLFRIIVWGTAEILFLETCKRFAVDPYQALFLLFCLFITKFVYARVTLAMAIYFYGVSFFCSPIERKKILSAILGFSIILLSAMFHRSMIAVVLITPIMFMPLSKKSFLIILIGIPILTFMLRNFLEAFSYFFVEEDRVAEMENYSSEKGTSEFFKADLLFWWGTAAFFSCFFVVSYIIFKSKIKIGHTLSLLYRLTFGITVFSYCGYFLRPENPTLFYRYLYMTMIPLTLLLMGLRKNGLIKQKTIRYLALIGISPEAATFLYRVFIKFTPIGYH